MKNLVLIGMPGSGKSAVGRRLAARLGLTLLDTDAMVEERAGLPIPQIFAQWGEARFRDLETAAVCAAAQTPNSVIATGGGVVLRPENMAALAATGVIFFRDRSPADIVGEDLSDRPLVGGDRERVFQLYTQRIDLYCKYAQYRIVNTNTADEAAEQIAALYEKECER